MKLESAEIKEDHLVLAAVFLSMSWMFIFAPYKLILLSYGVTYLAYWWAMGLAWLVENRHNLRGFLILLILKIRLRFLRKNFYKGGFVGHIHNQSMSKEKIESVYNALHKFKSELKQFYPASTRSDKAKIFLDDNTFCLAIDDLAFVYADVEHGRFAISIIVNGGTAVRVASNLDKSVAQPLLVSMLAPADYLQQFEPTTFETGGENIAVIDDLLSIGICAQ